MYEEIMAIQDKIAEIIDKEGKTVHFIQDWIEPMGGKFVDLTHTYVISDFLAKVSAFTFNSLTKETFLLKEVTGKTHLECLKKILDYVEHNKETIDSFTVHWSKKENGVLGSYNTSYFYCHNILEVMDKFFTNKDVKDYVIYDIKLNPIA